MNEFEDVNEVLDIPEEDRNLDDWKRLINFYQSHATFMNSEAMRLLKENLALRVELDKLNRHFDKLFGLPKRKKSVGLLQAPRGRPLKKNANKQLIEGLKHLRSMGYSWTDISSIIDSVNTQRGTRFPISERYLRSLLKSAE